MKALKYLLIFIILLIVFISSTSIDWITHLSLLYIFEIILFSDLFFKVNSFSFNKEEIEKNNKHRRYERVKYHHSWNSNHITRKLVLFSLSLHSYHYNNGSIHYQILKSLLKSPQIPTVYLGTMLLSLFSPLRFRVMNKKLQEI